jgi:hypothetical protein
MKDEIYDRLARMSNPHPNLLNLIERRKLDAEAIERTLNNIDSKRKDDGWEAMEVDEYIDLLTYNDIALKIELA